jgi:hypothetical protein
MNRAGVFSTKTVKNPLQALFLANTYLYIWLQSSKGLICLTQKSNKHNEQSRID